VGGKSWAGGIRDPEGKIKDRERKKTGVKKQIGEKKQSINYGPKQFYNRAETKMRNPC